jgi:Rad52/22 family double-strand break repair protein
MSDYETAQDLFDALSAPFLTDYIEWRIGSMNAEKTRGLPLAYIDARAVMDRLDSACGIDGWQCRYQINGTKTVCELGIRMPDREWIWKADGAGDTDFEAEKGALSDAFKRVAVRFGVGRYLYELKSGWIVLENKRIPDTEQNKLNELHEKAILQFGWGPRGGVQVYRLLKKIVSEYVTSAADAQRFKDDHKSEIALLHVAMRRHLYDLLDRIGATESEAA